MVCVIKIPYYIIISAYEWHLILQKFKKYHNFCKVYIDYKVKNKRRWGQKQLMMEATEDEADGGGDWGGGLAGSG